MAGFCGEEPLGGGETLGSGAGGVAADFLDGVGAGGCGSCGGGFLVGRGGHMEIVDAAAVFGCACEVFA